MPKKEIFCVKCKKFRRVHFKRTKLKNGREAIRGKCPECKSEMFRFI